MSLVQAVITKKFILVAAETMGTKKDGTVIENCNKLIKLNKQIVIGYTGRLEDNYELFGEFCNYAYEQGLTKIKDNIDISYKDLIKIITNKFKQLEIIHKDKTNPKSYEIISMVCGYNGNEFEVVTFKLSSNEEEPNGISIKKREQNFPFRCISAGKTEHKKEFDKIANQYNDIRLYDFKTIRQYKNILTEVFEKGAKSDNTINDKIKFERITLNDIYDK